MDIVRPWEYTVIYQYNFRKAIILKKVKANIWKKKDFIAGEKAKLLKDFI